MKATLLSAIRTAYNAFCGIDSANKKAVERAHETAKALFADIGNAEDGAALRDAISEAKAAAFGSIKPKNGNQWKNLWSHVSDFCFCWFAPETPVVLGEGQTAVSAGGIANAERPLIANVRKAATAARKASGVGGMPGNGKGEGTAQRAPRTPDTKAVPADDAAAASGKAFEANAANVAALVERIIGMPSGIGLLADALKAHGYGVVKLSAPPKAYDIPPPKALPEPKRQPKVKKSKTAGLTQQTS